MKTVLIPTDLSVRSLNLVITALRDHKPTELNILLAHGMTRSSSFTDLIFESSKKRLEGMLSEDFRNAAQFIENTFRSQLQSIIIDTFSGVNQRSFNNYLEANKVDAIYHFDKNDSAAFDKNCFSLMPFIEKCEIPCSVVHFDDLMFAPDRGKGHEINALFFTKS
ncbi:hypothetical protein LVD15_23495 [Fulvivirga maritima]|uniref:hypothetical protein n=1 Tax=Fulvivirga maritima TaxID=2904247 RepID=UPI001F44AB93|nr:hypothetical protein [Fulvivirga maritima]UII26229.1 hypothetical protein LVD15_23495 [Fulvivirga maritima]